MARRMTRVARRITAEGPGSRVSTALDGLTKAVREFADDVRIGMAERDGELRTALGISTDGGPAPDADPAAVEGLLRPDRVRSPF